MLRPRVASQLWHESSSRMTSASLDSSSVSSVKRSFQSTLIRNETPTHRKCVNPQAVMSIELSMTSIMASDQCPPFKTGKLILKESIICLTALVRSSVLKKPPTLEPSTVSRVSKRVETILCLLKPLYPIGWQNGDNISCFVNHRPSRSVEMIAAVRAAQ